MKGFIKILEAIIASVVILTSLTFFFNTQLKDTGWSNTLLKIRADDSLAALIRSGDLQQYVRANDAAGLNDLMLDTDINMFPITVDYSIEIRGPPNPVIYVGCDCTQAQVDNLRSYLGPLDFQYKSRDISIRIEFDSIDAIRNETNAIVIFGYRNLNPNSQSLSRFLERDGTIILIGDLTQAQVNDGYINSTFGLRWAGGSRSNSGTFYNSNNENLVSFKIENYYMNITRNAANFDFAGTAAIQQDDSTIVTGSMVSLVKINKEIVNGHGRTIWMADPVRNPPTSNLTKSMIMWGSGESFKMDAVVKRPGTNNFKTSAIVYDLDPYEVVLTVWNVFQ